MKNIFKEYNEYLKDNPKGYWFKRKLYGWGWTPVKWQGWFSIFVYILLLFIFISINDNPKIMLLPVIFLTILLIFICYKKGEKPRWQWGFNKVNKK